MVERLETCIRFEPSIRVNMHVERTAQHLIVASRAKVGVVKTLQCRQKILPKVSLARTKGLNSCYQSEPLIVSQFGNRC